MALSFLDKQGVSTLWKRVKQEVNALDTANTELEKKVTANTQAIAKLNGDGEGSVAKAVADVLAKIMGEGEVNASYDTLKEISDWILKHPESVAEINSRILALEELVGEDSVEDQILAALTDYVTKTELNSAKTELKNAIDAIHVFENEDVLDDITSTDITNLRSIKALTDTEISEAIAAAEQE